MLFGKNKKKNASPSAQLLCARHGRTLQYVTLRDTASNNETVLGKDGVLNVVEDECVILCGNDTVFRASLSDITAYELMNLSGINLRVDGRSYVAYYTKGIENK